MDVKTTRTIAHQCSASNEECVMFMRTFPGFSGTFPYTDIRDDQCCICYFSGEECPDDLPN